MSINAASCSQRGQRFSTKLQSYFRIFFVATSLLVQYVPFASAQAECRYTDECSGGGGSTLSFIVICIALVFFAVISGSFRKLLFSYLGGLLYFVGGFYLVNRHFGIVAAAVFALVSFAVVSAYIGRK
jgi:hypothetical protein